MAANSHPARENRYRRRAGGSRRAKRALGAGFASIPAHRQAARICCEDSANASEPRFDVVRRIRACRTLMPINSIATTLERGGAGLDPPPGNPLGALSEFRLDLRRAIAASHHRNEEPIERECHDASTKNLLARALPALSAAASRMRRRCRRRPRCRRECGDGRQDVASLGRISGFAERQPELRQLPAVPGTECLQERRRRDQSAGLVQNLGKNLSTRRNDSAASICRLQRSRAWVGQISKPAGLGREMTAGRPERLPRYAWDNARRPELAVRRASMCRVPEFGVLTKAGMLLMSINSRVLECYSPFPTQAFWRAS